MLCVFKCFHLFAKNYIVSIVFPNIPKRFYLPNNRNIHAKQNFEPYMLTASFGIELVNRDYAGDTTGVR